MGRRTIIGGLLSVAALGGCGGSTHSASTTNSVATTAPASSSAPHPAIAHRLLTTSEMPTGVSAAGNPTVATSIQQWLSGEQLAPGQTMSSETARLKRIGFLAAARLNLNSAAGAGISIVEQLRSSAGARAELANTLSMFKASNNGGVGVVTFRVAGIPGAIGFGGPKTQPGSGVNVAFTDGDYFYLVGEEANAPANRAAVIAAAQKLYHRVNS